MTRIIVDIVGQAGSGKSSVCVDLVPLGFEIYRPSDVLRTYANTHGITLNGRQDYIRCHEALIAEDPMAIIRPILESSADHIVLDGMRAPAPFIALREQLDAKLVYLTCPPTIRLQRILADNERSGHRQITSLEELLADEAPDAINPNPHLPNMLEMERLADYTVDASRPYDEVIDEVRCIIGQLEHVER